MSRHDVIIIGSGLGGLLCAGILARAGLDVLVLEQGAQPGGCMQTYRRQGLDFDTGFHYVGGLDEGTPMHAVFRHLGLMRLPWQRMDRLFDRVTIGGQTRDGKDATNPVSYMALKATTTSCKRSPPTSPTNAPPCSNMPAC